MAGDAPAGAVADMLARLKAALPPRWFADETPVLDGLLTGLADTASWAFGLLAQVRAQARLATATGGLLDLFATDHLGARLTRRDGEADDAYRARIRPELLRERATRAALAGVLEDLTGRAPRVFEPMRPADTGAWGHGSLGYGAAGGWGSLALPFQCLVTAYRPLGGGVAGVPGWGGPAGWGVGLEYAGPDMLGRQVSDADIRAAIAGVMPVATIAWTRITN